MDSRVAVLFIFCLTTLFVALVGALDVVPPANTVAGGGGKNVGKEGHPHKGSHFRHSGGGSSDLPRFHGINKETISHAQTSVDCTAFLQPINERRNQCLRNTTSQGGHIVDLCVYFASDYNYIVPFLAHHLALGVHKIFIYNNDEKTPWYNHPAVLCLLGEKMIEIQPWYGENALMKGLDHCYFRRIPESYEREMKEANAGKDSTTGGAPAVAQAFGPNKLPAKPILWGANFDIDEMLVLHKHQCIGNFVSTYEAPSIALNWAFFTPESPLSDYARTGNVAFMSKEHKALINYGTGLGTNAEPILLPHEMLLRRMHENPHIKTINRLECADHWENEHCPQYKATCPYGLKPVDPQGHFIKCGPWTPWVDNNYPVAQLNHYWTLSLTDFLRKIHRGKGGSYAKNTDQFRNTGEFFNHAWIKEGFVDDIAMIKYYAPFFQELKNVCPRCFDLSYYYMQS